MHLKSMTSFMKYFVLSACLTSGLTFTGCKDDYFYDDTEPSKELLGSSIYAYLQERGDFTYYLRLINDLGYQETLSRTGSKTIFAASDAAFERFFKSNPYGVGSYDELTPSMKRELMNTSMINMAYLAEMLSNVAGTDGAVPGRAIRRFTSGSMLDKVDHVTDPDLLAYPYWKRFRDKPLYLVSDADMLVHFTSQQMNTMGMTSSDFSLIMNGTNFAGDDIYVNGIKVINRDVICKNGYVHEMADVLVPAGTMAGAIEDAPEASMFAHLLNRFSAPYYTASESSSVKEFYNGSTPLRPSLGDVDSIFRKRYFNERSCPTGPGGESLTDYGMLYYDPAEVAYSQASPEEDMGTMFVPTDEALNEFFNGSKGRFLRDAYGTWDNVPNDILASFLKNHQKRSFSASLPHAWGTLTDETSYDISVSPANVERTQLTGNGVVYFINTVFPPIDYQGVYGSVLTADNTTIMKWAITDDWNNMSDTEAMRYYMYLRSMENMYNLLVPTDEALRNYRDPLSWARGGANREIWEFYYDNEEYSSNGSKVKARVYACDAAGNRGELKRTITDKTVLRNRLRDIIDLHIIIGENEGGRLTGYIDETDSRYVLTKGGGTIALSGRGNGLKVNGGGDMETGKEAASVVTADNGGACRYDSDNGRTFFIDHILHDATTSVYDKMQGMPECKAFLDLCRGNDLVFATFQNDKDVEEIFATKTNTVSKTTSIGNIVSFFNNYRYTILVPTEDALKAAFASDPDLYTWDEIAMEGDYARKKAKTLYLLKFLRFHFVDNAAFVTGVPFGPLAYETSARNEFDKFHKVSIESDGKTLTIRGVDAPDADNVAHVITTPGSYNQMARDFIVNDTDVSKATRIESSSRAVIHVVDKALRFK